MEQRLHRIVAAKEIKDYFSDAKKGTLTLKGALYLEGSLFVEVNGNHKVIKARKENRDKLILEIAESHIEKIIRALGSSRSVKMFHPLIRWACRLHPKKKAFILESDEDLYEWRMYSRPRTATEKRAYRRRHYNRDNHESNFFNCCDDIRIEFKRIKLYYMAIKQLAKLQYSEISTANEYQKLDGRPRKGMTIEKLKRRLRQRGLTESGNKDALIARLIKADGGKKAVKYPELLNLLLLPREIYHNVSPFTKDSRYSESYSFTIDNSNLLAAEILAAIGNEKVRDILVYITNHTQKEVCNKYLTFGRSVAHDSDYEGHFEGIKNLTTISLSKMPKLKSDKKTLSVLLKRLESKDLAKRRHAAIALMDAMDKPDLDILWKVTRTFLEWERDRAKHLREEYGGRYR